MVKIRGDTSMTNFFIYEDELKWQQEYKNIILKLMEMKKQKYQIFTINAYQNNTLNIIQTKMGKKIYIFDIEVPGKSGIDLAKEIRSNGDWTSPIIIITSHEHFKNEGYTSKILMLNFIIKKENWLDELFSTLNLALEINRNIESFYFKYDSEYYQIPIDDIFYFEKNLNENYISIITKYESYKIKKSIKNLMMDLKNKPQFFNSHQSCILNINNIKKVDFKNNYIYFANKETNLLSRNKKKELKNILEKRQNYDNI